MQRVYGARFEPQFQGLKELNSKEVVSSTRLTIFNDAFIKNVDDGEYKGKKNYRFVVGSSQEPITRNFDVYLFQPYIGNREFTDNVLKSIGKELNWSNLKINSRIAFVVFDARDRSLYLMRFDNAGKEVYHESSLFIDSKCNFSSEYFENSLELPKNIVYKLNYLERELIEVARLEN